MRRWSRRETLTAGAAAVGTAALGGIHFWPARRRIQGAIVGASNELGHRLREGSFPPPSQSREVPIAILGGGISGLGAAWRLQRGGFDDFLIFEMESVPGGTARAGQNSVSPFPWGAHYVPVPNPESRDVRRLFEDLDIITGYRGDEPIYEERYLCFAPQERLFIDGEWREGLLPQVGASHEDLEQFRDFNAAMDGLRRRGAFSIPADERPPDDDLAALDRMTMADFLDRHGWTSPRLRWIVEYACRDDYGCTLETTSAWAGVHYFASRASTGLAHEDRPLLTWPEGNGWIVQRLVERIGPRLVCGRLVTRVEVEKASVRVEVYDPVRNATLEVRCRHAIFALPQHVRKFVVARSPDFPEFTYAPWMVANLTVDRVPEGRGFPPAWDNVLFDSPSLGYVVATHQSLSSRPGPSVLTYYRPLTGQDPVAERRSMSQRTWQDWCDEILADLSRAHPTIASEVSRIDVMRWGHAMVRPVPTFLWGEARRRAAEPIGNLFFAHSDLGGLPLFEEALHRGVAAAEAILGKG
jgi:hypothetical protein